MADVRALLRSERLARRITHQYASYSTSGTLSCTVCNLRLQAESLWEPHLAGKVHRQNLQRAQSAIPIQAATSTPLGPPPLPAKAQDSQANGSGNGNARKRKAGEEEQGEPHATTVGKKRKAIDSDGEEAVEEISSSRESTLRKKIKPTSRGALPPGFFDARTSEDVLVQQEEQDGQVGDVTMSGAKDSVPSIPQTGELDDEYAAFEAAIAAAPPEGSEGQDDERPVRNAFTAGADIAAAPISAADLAAQEAANASTQRRGREEEIEGEKEDAARALEEEFDEMDQLEARVRKLKEMRERIRRIGRADGGDVVGEQVEPEPEPVPPRDGDGGEHDDVDDDDDDDYDDGWGFR